jgi:hypothetical protein
LARGYTGTQQILQIGIGVVLALLFAATGTIGPLVAFRVLLNISGNVTSAATVPEVVMLVLTVISAAYAVYLVSILRHQGAGLEGPASRKDTCGVAGAAAIAVK